MLETCTGRHGNDPFTARYWKIDVFGAVWPNLPSTGFVDVSSRRNLPCWLLLG